MPRIPIFKLGSSGDENIPPVLASYTPSLSLEGLSVGVDNLRHDVHLSPKFTEAARAYVARLIARHGDVEGLLAAEAPAAVPRTAFLNKLTTVLKPGTKSEHSDFKTVLTELHVAALNRAKADNSVIIDLLARLAVVKFLRMELNSQFAQVLERGRMMLKSYEGVRQQKALEYRERVASFQVRKKIIQRKTGQDLFLLLRDIEKETLARMRRSRFGESDSEGHKLLINRLVLSEDGRDDYLCAEQYVMLGNWDRDPDRFIRMREIICEFLRSLQIDLPDEDAELDPWLNAPENAHALVGGGTPSETTPEGRSQKERLLSWVRLLEDQSVMEYVISSYEVVPLLSEYGSRINPQQLKNALVDRAECSRVERLIQEGGRLSANNLYAAVGRVAGCRGADRARVAGRFLRDFLRYHRDMRRLEALNSALDSINLIGNAKLRELSSVNGTLYEFLLPEEQKPAEERALGHVIIKADIRDSTRLTRSLMDSGLNPASYFSLNFYDPVNKLLPKYGASKVFIEGDAVILALHEKEGEPGLAVSRACVLAREMVEIVRGYNEQATKAGLPPLELGVGISYQEAAPLYLMDGEKRIMISEALNESDRLSSCNKRARKAMEPLNSPFHVYAFQTVSDADAGEAAEDFVMAFNLGGIRLSPAAFQKLRKEISLEPLSLQLPELWGSEGFKLYRALVTVDNDIFRKIVLRESRVAQVDPRNFTLQKWTEKSYYEVCSDPSIYAELEGEKAAAAARS
jgi:class 3 adenylate cyclase